jgi:hypothetical protein
VANSDATRAKGRACGRSLFARGRTRTRKKHARDDIARERGAVTRPATRQVLEELQSRPVSNDKDRKEVLEILKRMRDQEIGEDGRDVEEDEEEEHGGGNGGRGGDPLEGLLEGLEIDEGTEWADLTPEQQGAFQKAAAGGLLASLVDVWDPWWMHGRGTVLPMDGEEAGQEESASRPPPIPAAIPSLSTLTSKQPSELLAYGLVDIMWSYAKCQRWCNGEAASDPSVSQPRSDAHPIRIQTPCYSLVARRGQGIVNTPLGL